MIHPSHLRKAQRLPEKQPNLLGMHGRLFTLVSADGDDAIFAWGIEISDSNEREAVIYRRDPDTREITHGVHDSADAARERYTRMMCVPFVVEYMDYLDEIKTLSELLDNIDGHGPRRGPWHEGGLVPAT